MLETLVEGAVGVVVVTVAWLPKSSGVNDDAEGILEGGAEAGELKIEVRGCPEGSEEAELDLSAVNAVGV
jgi:hypothetical protein